MVAVVAAAEATASVRASSGVRDTERKERAAVVKEIRSELMCV
jgi:hypothetical protein